MKETEGQEGGHSACGRTASERWRRGSEIGFLRASAREEPLFKSAVAPAGTPAYAEQGKHERFPPPFLLHTSGLSRTLCESSLEFARFDPQGLENSKSICRKMYSFLSRCVCCSSSNVAFYIPNNVNVLFSLLFRFELRYDPWLLYKGNTVKFP